VAGADVKVLVIGLDGGTLDIIRPLAEAGRLPTFRRLMEEGAWGVLESTIPPATPPAWASFMTGKNPGKHSVYDMFRMSPSGEVSWANATWVKGIRFWDLLGRDGVRVGIIDVPMTFPPSPVNGYMISGMFTPSRDVEFTHPSTLYTDLLKEIGSYPLERELVSSFAAGDILGGLRSVCEHTEKRKQAALFLLRKRDAEFVAVVFRGPDVVQHYGFRFTDEEYRGHYPRRAAKYRKIISQYYEVLDGVIAELLDAVSQSTTTIIMSDHGGGPVWRFFYINKWLRDKRLLATRPLPALTTLRPRVKRATIPAAFERLGMGGLGRLVPPGLRKARFPSVRLRRDPTRVLDWSRTRAFADVVASPISITINRRRPGWAGRDIDDGECERLRREIADGLLALREPSTGEPIVGRIWTREEIYSGPFLGDAPDLTFLTTDDKYRSQRQPLAPSTIAEPDEERLGMHRMEGVLMMRGPAVKAGYAVADARIVDLAPTILHLFGMDIPADMDGSVLTEALKEEYLARHPVRWSEAAPEMEGEVGAEGEVFTDEESGRIEENLRGLEYLG
jgi:predicted AlkP superfamily phosphohydrolase/phosphomutase